MGKRVGLVLGGGGARGWAHIGVLHKLREYGISLHCIVGTSAGAIVAAAFAAGRLDQLEETARNLDWKKAARLFVEVGPLRSGLLTGRPIERLLEDILECETIEALQCPFAAVATDLHSREEVVLDHGRLVPALRASCSLPGIFTPVKMNNRFLVDGGLVNPLPVSVARALGADFTIAVDVNLKEGSGEEAEDDKVEDKPSEAIQRAGELLDSIIEKVPRLREPADRIVKHWMEARATPSILDVLTLSTRLVENRITEHRLATDPPDVLIQPAVGDIFTLDFPKAARAISAGVRAAEEHRAELLPLAAASLSKTDAS